jgi:hypothetical protein
MTENSPERSDFESVTDEAFEAEWAKVSAEKASAADPEQKPAEQPEPTEKPAEPPPPPPDAPKEPEKPDPLSLVQSTIAELAKSHQETVGNVRQISSAVAQLNQTKAEAAIAAAAPTPKGLTEAEIAAAAKDPDEWEQIKAENPEWGKAIEKVLEHRLKAAIAAQPKVDADQIAKDIEARIRAGLQSEIAPVVQSTLTQSKQAERQMSEAYQAVAAVHPEWTKTIATPEFESWKAKQSPGIRALYTSPDPDDAIQMLNLYVGSKPAEKPTGKSADQVAAERQAKLSQSVIPTGAQASRGQVDTTNMTWEEDWALLSKLKQANKRAA